MPPFRLALAIVIACVVAPCGAAERARPIRPSVPTFNREVVRILQQQCQACHREGDVAPFPLVTYEDAAPRAQSIRSMTSARLMPPWKASAACAEFTNERRLTDEQIATIAQWADAGAPEGSPLDLPPPVEFPSEWVLGPPDTVYEMSESYAPPAGGDTYRCFPLAPNGPEETFIRAIDVRPGDRETVHHVLAYVDTTGASLDLDTGDPGPGYTCFGGPGFALTGGLGGWAPGLRPAELPDGVALSLPAGARIVIQVHYHPHDEVPMPDRTAIGVYETTAPVHKILRYLPIANRTFSIPAGASDHRVVAEVQVPFFVGLEAYSVTPHMHLLGRSMTVEAVSLLGQSRCLVEVPAWDFQWQTTYSFREPVALGPLTTIRVTAVYDNSPGNPLNPNNPPKEVRWGEQTTDEMCLAFLGVTIETGAALMAPDGAATGEEPSH